METILGTVVASKMVQGDTNLDTYSTHLSILGTGGYMELATIAERNAIPIDFAFRLQDSNNTGQTNGLSSGRRRLGMLVYVAETDIIYQLNIPYSTWSGLTNINKVNALGDNLNWVEFSAGGGDAIKKKYYEPAHGFQVGDVVGFNGTNYVKKIASPFNTDETIGIASKINDIDNFTVTYAGFIDTTAITGLSANTVYFVSPTIAGALTPYAPLNLGEENRPILITQTVTTGLVIMYRGQIITENVISGTTGTTFVAGVIGPAEDGTYLDGIYTDFLPTTPTGTAIDRFNELFKQIVPTPAPDLLNFNRTGTTLNSAKLSFGATRNDIGYTNVTAAIGNSIVDINGTYAVGGTRLGVTNTVISGKLNDNVIATTAYPAGAFDEGDQGTLELYVNGLLKGSLILTGGTAATSNTRFSVSQVNNVTFSNGNQFTLFKYRTGTFTVLTADMVTGFNYARVLHVKPSGNVQTNYIEWVYDSNGSALSTSAVSFSGLTLSGSKYISGVRYNTGGTVTYNATILNAYRNLYANGNAISYPTRFNLADAGVINKTGAGVVTDNTSSRALPILNTAVTNPEATTLTLVSTHTLQNSILGNIGSLGKIETNISILHPIKSTLTSGVASTTGFLQYPTIQVADPKIENFTGEINRLHDRNYVSLPYANIDGGTYVWDGTQSLVGGNSFHNTGLLVFNGELMYPNAPYLGSTYGINNGNFGGVSNILAGNPNYSTATGIRVYARKFKSTNPVTQSTLNIQILHTGSNSAFLLDGGTGGTAIANFIKMECLIKRVGGQTHGWFNPFALTLNPEGISNIDISTIVGGTSVTCTLSTVPRIGNGDIVVIRIYAASGYTNRISNINVVNI